VAVASWEARGGADEEGGVGGGRWGGPLSSRGEEGRGGACSWCVEGRGGDAGRFGAGGGGEGPGRLGTGGERAWDRFNTRGR